MPEKPGIDDLIPQRDPVRMIDTLYEATVTEAHTGLSVSKGNIFFEGDHLSEMGLIENMAQSAAATAGVRNFLQGIPPSIGYIGEIKKCIFHSFPHDGEKLHTFVHYVSEAAGVTLYDIENRTDSSPCAQCRMKVFIEQ